DDAGGRVLSFVLTVCCCCSVFSLSFLCCTVVRASDDKRYGLEFLSQVTITINTNVKLNSLMCACDPPPRPPPRLFFLSSVVFFFRADAVLSPRGRPTSGRTASGNGCERVCSWPIRSAAHNTPIYRRCDSV
ncbi:membrane-associated protein, putative, partial [Bodo saltans]